MKLYDMIVASKVLGGGGGVTPSGTINITQNGDADVTNYATAHVAVPQPSGKITITQNGTDIDVAQYATADVNVSGGGGDEMLAGVIDKSIKDLVVPNGVATIGENIFQSCTLLETAKLPGSVTVIGSYAFAWCSNLKTITVEAVTPPKLAASSLNGLSSLQHIYVPAESVDAYKTANNWDYKASQISAIPSA